MKKNFKLCEEEELASLFSDRDLKLNYAQLPLYAFWISVMGEHPPTLSKKPSKYYHNSQLRTYVNWDFPT